MGKTLYDRLLERFKNKRVIAIPLLVVATVGGIASFTDSINKIFSALSALVTSGATPVILPNDTGWIFAGYYDEDLARFVQGPYVKIVRSNYPSRQPIPRIGEWVRVSAERNLIIADFATMGLTRQYDPPWKQNVLRHEDYTGLKLPKGATVEVRDVSAGSFPGRPEAVWIRAGAIR